MPRLFPAHDNRSSMSPGFKSSDFVKNGDGQVFKIEGISDDGDVSLGKLDYLGQAMPVYAASLLMPIG